MTIHAIERAKERYGVKFNYFDIAMIEILIIFGVATFIKNLNLDRKL